MKARIKLLFLVAVISVVGGCDKQDDPYLEDPADLQLKSAETRTINFPMTGEYYTPVICDGKEVDLLYLPEIAGQNAHITAHLVNGRFVWFIVHCKLAITSQQTGETFKVNDQTKVIFDENGEYDTFTMHIHAKGDKGTHVIMFFEFDRASQTLEFPKGVCPQNTW